jgi:transposase
MGRVVELAMTDEEVARLTAVSHSRTEPASRVERARMLLAYRETPSFFAVAPRLGAHHQTVQRCVERALAYGSPVALDDRPRPGKEPTITPEVKAWLVSFGVRQGQGARVSTRAVDDAPFGTSAVGQGVG